MADHGDQNKDVQNEDNNVDIEEIEGDDINLLSNTKRKCINNSSSRPLYKRCFNNASSGRDTCSECFKEQVRQETRERKDLHKKRQNYLKQVMDKLAYEAQEAHYLEECKKQLSGLVSNNSQRSKDDIYYDITELIAKNPKLSEIPGYESITPSIVSSRRESTLHNNLGKRTAPPTNNVPVKKPNVMYEELTPKEAQQRFAKYEAILAEEREIKKATETRLAKELSDYQSQIAIERTIHLQEREKFEAERKAMEEAKQKIEAERIAMDETKKKLQSQLEKKSPSGQQDVDQITKKMDETNVGTSKKNKDK